jgi:Caspase domain
VPDRPQSIWRRIFGRPRIDVAVGQITDKILKTGGDFVRTTGLAFRGTLIAAVACLALACLTWTGATPALADNRVALVIGNGAYVHVPHLPNPSNDADDVAAALKRTGFQTIVGKDLDQSGMQDVVIKFARAARTADVAVFYYSGHAMQYGGVNYLFPIDAQLSDEADLVRMARVDDILANLKQAKNLRILVLDACRNNPFADQLKESIGPTRGVSIERGLARIQSQDGTIISYSTQAGRTAKDGDGRNSPYTSAFLRHIEDKEDIATVFHHISASVYESTKGTQVPELSLSYFGEFYLNGKLQAALAPPASPADPCAAASDHWRSAEAINTRGAFEDHLARFPNCAFAGLARARIEVLSKAAVAPVPAPASASPVPADGGWSGYLGGLFSGAAPTAHKETTLERLEAAPPTHKETTLERLEAAPPAHKETTLERLEATPPAYKETTLERLEAQGDYERAHGSPPKIISDTSAVTKLSKAARSPRRKSAP